jgi:hypothetical protein
VTFLFAAVRRFRQELLRGGWQMSQVKLATVLSRTVALFAFLGKFAAPSFTSAPKSSRQALVPTVKMLPTRRNCHGLHYLSRILLFIPLLQRSGIAQPKSEQNCSPDRACLWFFASSYRDYFSGFEYLPLARFAIEIQACRPYRILEPFLWPDAA